MSDKTKETKSCTSQDLAKFLASLPDNTCVMLESADEIDPICGAYFLPRLGVVSLVGASAEFYVDEEDWDSVQMFGDLALEEVEEEEVANDPTYAELTIFPEGADVEHVVLDSTGLPEKPKKGEIDAPLRP